MKIWKTTRSLLSLNWTSTIRILLVCRGIKQPIVPHISLEKKLRFNGRRTKRIQSNIIRDGWGFGERGVCCHQIWSSTCLKRNEAANSAAYFVGEQITIQWSKNEAYKESSSLRMASCVMRTVALTRNICHQCDVTVTGIGMKARIEIGHPSTPSSDVSSTAKTNHEEQLRMKVRDILNQKYCKHINFFKKVYAIKNFDICIGTRTISICFDSYRCDGRTISKYHVITAVWRVRYFCASGSRKSETKIY